MLTTERKLRVAMIGCGQIARLHAQRLAADGRAEITVCCDPRREAAVLNVLQQIGQLSDTRILSARPGDRIPQAKDLAAVLGVNTNTVLRALRLLRDR